MVDTANNKFTETEEKADESFNGIVDSVEESVNELNREFDRGTGEVLGGWKAFCNKTKKWWAEFKAKFTVEEDTGGRSRSMSQSRSRSFSVEYSRPLSVGSRSISTYGLETASGFRSAMGLDTQEELLRQVLASTGTSIQIERFENNREQDVAQLAKELEYYRQRYNFSKGVR